jgi:hypothetical protein
VFQYFEKVNVTKQTMLQQKPCICSNKKVINNIVSTKMINNKNHQLFQQKTQIITIKIITYLKYFRISKKYENIELVAKPLQHIEFAFQTKLVRVCYILTNLVHGGPNLGKNIVTSYMGFRYINHMRLLQK